MTEVVPFADRMAAAKERGAKNRENVSNASKKITDFLHRVAVFVTDTPEMAVEATKFAGQTAVNAGVEAGKAVGKAAVAAGEAAIGLGVATAVGAYEASKFVVEKTVEGSKAAYHAAERAVDRTKTSIEGFFNRCGQAADRLSNRAKQIVENTAGKAKLTAESVGQEIGAFVQNVHGGFAGAEASVKGFVLDRGVDFRQGVAELARKTLEGTDSGLAVANAAHEASVAKTNEIKDKANDKKIAAAAKLKAARDIRI